MLTRMGAARHPKKAESVFTRVSKSDLTFTRESTEEAVSRIARYERKPNLRNPIS
jgi:hypothetical protein